MAGGNEDCELIFEDCLVPAANVLGQIGQGLPAGLGYLTLSRLSFGALSVGTARYALETGCVVGSLAEITAEKETAQALLESEHRLLGALQGAINALSTTTEWRDAYTAGHQQRVARLACAIAREMDLPEYEVQGIHVAGLLHDIGKIAVPLEILCRSMLVNHLIERALEVQKSMLAADILKLGTIL